MLHPMIKRLAVLCLLISPAWADEPKAPARPKAEAPHVTSFGSSDPTCLEWSNSCQVCIRNRPGDDVQCSTAGFACVPAPVVCRRR